MKKLNNSTLIDKIKLSNISVKSIDDMQDLREKGVLSCDTGKMKYVTGSGQEFSWLCIKDKKIDKYEAKCDGLHQRNQTILELSVKDNVMGNFICRSVNEVWEQIIESQGHLLEKYGIVTNADDPTVNYIEINRTFPVNGRFEDYKRALILMMSRLPKRKGVQIDFKNVSADGYEINEYVASNKSSAIKIYNKSMQMQFKLDADYMRVEITLKKSKVVKEAFGSNRLEDLTDKKIDDYFVEQMMKWFREPVELWLKNSKKEIQKIVVACRKKDVHWISSVLGTLLNKEVQTGVPIMLDVQQLLSVIDSMNIKRKGRIKDSFLKRTENVYTVFNQNDGDKLDEVLNKLTVQSEPDSQVKSQ